MAWAAAWRGRSGPGRSRERAGWGTCSPSSASLPASASWTSSPSSAPGSGCCPQEPRTRTTRTTPAPSPSPRCAPPSGTWYGPMTTRSSCGCGPGGTASWPASAPRPPAGCTPRCARSGLTLALTGSRQQVQALAGRVLPHRLPPGLLAGEAVPGCADHPFCASRMMKCWRGGRAPGVRGDRCPGGG